MSDSTTDTSDSASPPLSVGASRPQRRLRLLRTASAIVLTTLLLLALVGHLVRDRTVWLAALMYLPLLPLGILMLLLSVVPRRQPWRRRLPGILGLVAVVLSVASMTGGRPHSRGTSTDTRALTVLHWNVWWGGRGDTPEAWEAITSDIAGRTPDVVVLSEAPPAGKVEQLRTRLGPEWSAATWESAPGARYRFHLVVLSRWPVRVDARQDITDGKAMVASVATDDGPLRVLAVDGMSNWYLPRTPRLRDVARIGDSARQSGRPIDVIAGDFNCVSRSIGFDAIEQGGYALASRASGEWRGTWPVILPIYDLDHVWVRRERPVVSCDLFGSAYADHRGQVVKLAVSGRNE